MQSAGGAKLHLFQQRQLQRQHAQQQAQQAQGQERQGQEQAQAQALGQQQAHEQEHEHEYEPWRTPPSAPEVRPYDTWKFQDYVPPSAYPLRPPRLTRELLAEKRRAAAKMKVLQWRDAQSAYGQRRTLDPTNYLARASHTSLLLLAPHLAPHLTNGIPKAPGHRTAPTRAGSAAGMRSSASAGSLGSGAPSLVEQGSLSCEEYMSVCACMASGGALRPGK